MVKKEFTIRRVYIYISGISILVVTLLSVFHLSAGKSVSSSSEIDETVKKIASHFIKQAIDDSQSLKEVVAKVGVESDLLKQICIALDIDFELPTKEIEPVQISSMEKLSNNEYKPDFIIEYNGISPYLLFVDKTNHKLHLFKYKDGNRTIVNTFECKTGKNSGDKQEEGDHRTPEGAYFFVHRYSRSGLRRLTGQKNAYQYGEMAYVTNFPNSIDRLEGKNGGGIWLHGTDESFNETSPYDTRGCVVVSNETITTLSSYIDLYNTPLIIVDRLNFVNKQELETKRHEVLTMVEEWKNAWLEERIDDYINFYSQFFKSQYRNRSQWKQYKANVFKNYTIKHITSDNFTVIRHNNGMIVQFRQDYLASNLSAVGIKTLYLLKGKNSWEIIAEHFRKI